MSWAKYIFTYLIPSWFQTFRSNFRIWKDLMTGNYKDYALMWYDDPYEECYEWFWGSIGYDDTLDKGFLEHIIKLAKEVEDGQVKTYRLDEVIVDLRKDDGDV